MTQTQLEKRVAYWQNKMNLNHWRIESEIVDEVASGEEDADACIVRADDYDTATLQIVRSSIETNTPEYIDISICHELAHVHMRDLDKYIESLLWNASSSDAARALHPMFLHLREGLTDRLARIVVSNDK